MNTAILVKSAYKIPEEIHKMMNITKGAKNKNLLKLTKPLRGNIPTPKRHKSIKIPITILAIIELLPNYKILSEK